MITFIDVKSAGVLAYFAQKSSPTKNYFTELFTVKVLNL